MATLVLLLVVILALILRPRLSVERPGAMQQVAELLITNSMKLGIRDILDDSAGAHARSYIPLIGSVSLFILFGETIHEPRDLRVAAGSKARLWITQRLKIYGRKSVVQV